MSGAVDSVTHMDPTRAMGPIDELARAATRADGAAPLDEATLIAMRDGLGELYAVPGPTRLTALRFTHGGQLSIVVHPADRGNGIADMLVDDAPEGATTAWSHGNHPAAARLAARHGWTRVRDLWVMRRPAAPGSSATPELDGVRIRGYEPRDAREVVRVNAAAFASHPEQGAMDLANLERRMAEPWFDPAGLLVADAGDRLLGFHWTKRHDAALGEVYVVGIDPAAQGRGLGKALTAAGLEHLASEGVSEVILYVEADNAAALRLYGGLGFVHHDVDTHVQYRRR